MRPACGILLLASLATSLAAAADTPRVRLEIVMRPGLPATAPQEWQRTLAQLGVSGLRIRSGGGDEQVSLRRGGTPQAPSYRVVGILGADNRLYLPGGKFSVRETGKLRKWLADLADAGPEGVTSERGPFGLTPGQLREVHDDLSRPIAFSTQGLPATTAVRQIAGGLAFRLTPEAGAAAALRGVELENELKGLARGTALAAILRPAGLVFEPRRPRGGPLEYRVGKPTTQGEAWPVGWKPDKRAVETLPELFELLNVEIQDISVAEALAAIEGRMEVPFLFDRNAMALHGVDPADASAEVPPKRISYAQVLRTVLAQAKLGYRLRVDDADKPFLWITTLKPAP